MPNATLQRQYQRQLRSKREYGVFSQLFYFNPTTANSKKYYHRQGGWYTTTKAPIVYYSACAAGLLVVVVVVFCGGVMRMAHPTQAVGTKSLAPPVSPTLVMEQHAVAATQYSSSALQHTSRPTVTPPRKSAPPPPEYKRPDWLDDYLHWSSSVADNNDDDVPVLQWTCVGGNCGGLGDRILGIVQTFLLAVCNRRVFVVDSSGNSVPFTVPTQHQKRNYIPDPLRVVLDNRQDPFWDDDFLLNATTTPFLALKTNLWMGQKFWQSTCWQNMGVGIPDDEDDHAILQTVLRHVLPWPLETAELGRTWLSQAHVVQRPFIGVHLRTGRLDGTSQLFAQTAHIEPAIDCARGLAARCPHNDTSIYVATDDTHLRQHGLPADVQTMRDMQVEHYQTTTSQTRQQQATSPSMVELWMLSQADCVVGTPTSKFSYVAGLWAGCFVTAETCAHAAEQQHMECEEATT